MSAGLPFGLPRRPATGVGFGDWFEQHNQAQAELARQSGSTPQSGANGAANGSSTASNGTGWNRYMPAWADKTDGQSLLPNFFTGETTNRSFFVGLPVVVIRPHKFALCFTLGSLCFMGSFAMLRGPSEHMKLMCKQERLPFTAVYIISMLGTLYACLVLKSYLMVAIFSGVQATALVWYFCSMVPGGSRVYATRHCKDCKVHNSAMYNRAQLRLAAVLQEHTWQMTGVTWELVTANRC
eukprot:13055-Heterococcus_DN1.PRE.2